MILVTKAGIVQEEDVDYTIDGNIINFKTPINFMPDKEKKVRKPRNVQSIAAGAFDLPLSDRVQLCKDLQISIKTEVAALDAKAQAANELTKDL